MPELDIKWIMDNWQTGLLIILFIREFLNNLLIKVPSLKSNTIFECVYNTLDAFVATIKNRGMSKEITANEKISSDPGTAG